VRLNDMSKEVLEILEETYSEKLNEVRNLLEVKAGRHVYLTVDTRNKTYRDRVYRMAAYADRCGIPYQILQQSGKSQSMFEDITLAELMVQIEDVEK